MPADTVTAASAPTGDDGQKLLIAGEKVALRLWDEGQTAGKDPHACEHETVGYALEGEATLTVEGTRTTLSPGVSWHVPAGAKHHYAIPNRFKAIEATSPPARDA